MEEQTDFDGSMKTKWMYNPEIGRFLMIDPVIKHHESVYAWNTNNPILVSWSTRLTDSTE